MYRFDEHAKSPAIELSEYMTVATKLSINANAWRLVAMYETLYTCHLVVLLKNILNL